MSKYFGKYRGQVANNVDPMLQGRLQVTCPAVLGQGRSSWAMPCTPYAGSGVGVVFTPPVGANVWVEFEGGDPDYPIWAGCYWGTGERPTDAALFTQHLIKTDGVTIKIDATPGVGGVTIEVSPPAVGVPSKIVFGTSSVEITMGAASIKLDPAQVNVNNGALEVI